jgi:hypothetical protein
MLSYVDKPTEHSELLRSIKYAARKLLRTTGQLAEIVRFDRGINEPRLEYASLRSILQESLILFREDLHEEASSLIVDFPSLDPVYKVDRTRLSDALAGVLILAQSSLDARYTIGLAFEDVESDSSSLSANISVLTPLDHRNRSAWHDLLTEGTSELSTDSLHRAYTSALLNMLGATIEFTDVPPTLTVSFPMVPSHVHVIPTGVDLSRKVFSGKRIAIIDPNGSEWSFLLEELQPFNCTVTIISDPSIDWAQSSYDLPDVLVFRDPDAIGSALALSRSVKTLYSSRLPVLLLVQGMTIDDLELSRSFADAVLLAPYTEADVLRYLQGLAQPDRRAELRPLQLF